MCGPIRWLPFQILQFSHRRKTLLFGRAIDFVKKSAIDENKKDITLLPRQSSRYPEVKLVDLDYVDDIALLKDSDAKMIDTTEAIRETAGKLGLKMSFKKTEIISLVVRAQHLWFQWEMKASSRLWITLSIWEHTAVLMDQMLRSSIIGLAKHRCF